MLNQEQMAELREIEREKKATQQAEHRENVKMGMTEKQMYNNLQQDYDKSFGFNAFPYTHGDDVERAQEEATKKWRAELVDELERKGAIQTSHA